ncbi:MAG TPA: nitroreductase family protein [Methanothrix sp.]|nr:nitroreductase family protein [Methanothrix sp.]
MTDKNFEAWEVKQSDYPVDAAMAERLRFLLRYAILAPSGPNTQPWKFAINDCSISVYADLNRSLPHVDPSNRTLYMSVGCAIANLAIAAQHFGFAVDTDFFPGGAGGDLSAGCDLVAEVNLRQKGEIAAPNPADKPALDLFSQITQRHTTKDRFEDEPLPAKDLQRILGCIDSPGLNLTVYDKKEDRDRLNDLVSRAHKTQLARKEFRKNLSQWLRSNNTTQPDGMPLYTFGVPDAVSLGFPAAFKWFDLSRAVIYRDSGLIYGCSALAVLATDSDDRQTWTKCGLDLERMLLLATALNVRASFFSQPIGHPDLREELKSFIPRGQPQLIFSLGRSRSMRPSPRRPLEDVILK